MSISPHETYVHVTDLASLAEGSLHRFEVDGHVRILAHVEGGSLRALDGICTHQYFELAEGDLEGRTVWCPFHAAGFNADTGGAICLPATEPLRRYDVRTDNGEIFVSREPLAEA
jgi:nitrite reductase/ring-hydroxylating ferredoxin subunit